jgi:hypothetical protein
MKLHVPLCLRVKIFLRGRRGTDVRPGYLRNYSKGAFIHLYWTRQGRDVPPN